MTTFYSLFFFAMLLDALFGDPRWYPHPVRIIGKIIFGSEWLTRRYVENERLAGVLTVIVVLLSTVSLVGSLLFAAHTFSSGLGNVFAVFFLYTSIAGRDLLQHSNTVYSVLLEADSIAKARTEVSKIVGRDTSELDSGGVTKACVETVAENMVDGVTAPLFFAIIGSLVASFIYITPISGAVLGAFLYKAVNTMDSMIAYKNKTYIDFGRCAAQLDDVVNFIPARMSGLCIIITAFFLKLDYRGAARIFFRDRLQHASPNAGHTEAAVAGALGIRLGGPSNYFGKIVEKPYMGDSGRDLEPRDIKKTNQLVVSGSLVFVLFMVGLRSLFPF